MTSVGVTQFRSEISDIVSRVQYQRERVLLKKQGKPVAALIPIEDLAWLEELEDRLDTIEADRAERESAGRPTISFEDMKKRLGL